MTEYVVMFPFLAQGHFTRFLALAVQIQEKKGYNITIVSTPKNIQKLKSSPLNTAINFVEIPFCSTDHGLPPHCESTGDTLALHDLVNFFQATQTLKPAFQEIISEMVKEHNGKPPLCIIADAFTPWCGEVAHELNTFFAVYAPGAFSAACTPVDLPERKRLAAGEELLPEFPPAARLQVSKPSDTVMAGNQTLSQFIWGLFSKAWTLCDGFLANTTEDLEKSAFAYLREKLQRPVWGVGPLLLQPKDGARAGKQASITPEDCKDWLDSKPPHSVLYICFGSQNTLTASQMMQLAIALDHIDNNFIWVLRPPLGHDVNAEFKAEEWLPKGFEKRTKEINKGLLIHKWAPQVEILSHEATCGFLTHCGWNSVAEALRFGVPLLGWPMAADQFHNSYLLEHEIGISLELATGNNCEVRHEELRAKIELVLGETEKGKRMREKAIEVKEIVKKSLRCEEGFKGDSVKAIEDFLEAAALFRTKKKQAM